MPFADLGDVRLFYTNDGPADAGRTPILLVHGYAADSHDWVYHIPSWAADRWVIAPDLRGHGSSSAPPSGYRPEDLAGDLARLLDHLGVPQVIVVGHSMGAMVATALAVEHPGRVRAAVGVDPGYGQTAEIAAFFAPILDELRREPHQAVLGMEHAVYTAATPAFIKTWHARKIQSTPAHVLAQAFPAMFSDDGQFGVRPAADAYVARRDCPVLTCWASAEKAAWESELFKNPLSRAVYWPGAGHRLHEERPDEFLLVVDQWLAKLEKEEKQ